MLNNLFKKSDEELVRLIQKGQESALTELYNRYNLKLVRYFHRMLGRDKAKAEDFLQDLFLKIIDATNGIDTQRSFSTWIYSVAHNMCKNEYRKQLLRSNGKYLISEVTLQHDDIDRQKFKDEVDRWMAEAEVQDRSLFVMRYELELTVAKIATVMNVPEGTVKSKLFYLKLKLAERLKIFNPAV